VWIGLDFGTTNSGAALFDGRQVRLFSLDPAATPPTVVRSALYVQRDHQVLVGREAINAYYAQNSGRPRKIVRQYVGQLEQVFSDGLRVAEDIFARLDELSPGRLLRSLKSELAGEYVGTGIFGKNYELEELIGIYLRQIRERAEKEIGGRVEGVVLGKPVNFVGGSDQPGNQRAEERLRDAAERAGFRQVIFEFEPVAAALHYELTLTEPQSILVFDFGGGTLDVTVMRVGREEERQVFATGGVGLAGELFDRRIVEGLLLDHFGRGSTWGESSIPFPDQYTSALLNWQTILGMHRPETLHFLRRAQMTGNHPARIHALESLIVNDEGVRLFDRVEQAKIILSSRRFALIHLDSEEIKIWQPLTRSQFEALIAREIDRIKRCVLDTLMRSGLDESEIDAVVRTGGSAQIPAFIALLGDLFGPDKVVLSDPFSGVTAGLAIIAKGYW
jgi:hypothetical chaperone protein